MILTEKSNPVSMAKAFAIILMVLAHSHFSDFGSKLINMFHMPLFFFFSGYCFKEKYLSDFKSFSVKKVKGLYIPYVKWCLIFLLLHNIFFYLNIYNDTYGFRGKVSYEYGFKDFAFKAFLIVGLMSGNEQLLGGYWFIRSLFLSSLITFLVIKFVKKPAIPIVLFILISMLMSFYHKGIPFVGIGPKELLGSLFFYIGYLYKKNFDRELPLSIYFISALIVILGTFCWQMNLMNVVYWKILPWVISAIFGILFIYKLCYFIDKKNIWGTKLLIYIGDNTQTVLTWHFLSFKIISLLIIILYNLPYERLAEFPVIDEYSTKGWWLAYCFVGVFIPISVNMLFDYCKKRKTNL